MTDLTVTITGYTRPDGPVVDIHGSRTTTDWTVNGDTITHPARPTIRLTEPAAGRIAAALAQVTPSRHEAANGSQIAAMPEPQRTEWQAGLDAITTNAGRHNGWRYGLPRQDDSPHCHYVRNHPPVVPVQQVTIRSGEYTMVGR